MPPSRYQDNPRFLKVYPHVLRVEGGFVWHPDDPGGATNHGIAYNYNRKAVARYGISKPSQMRSLTKEQALQIYYDYYWLPSLADELPDVRLTFLYWDMVVNSGISWATQLLHRLPDQRYMHISGDGGNHDYWWRQSLAFLSLRMNFYTHAQNRKTFLEGWINRLVYLSQVLVDGRLN